MAKTLMWTKSTPILTEFYTARDFILWIASSGAIMVLLINILMGFEEFWAILTLGTAVTGFLFVLFVFVVIVFLRNKFTITYTLTTYGAATEVSQNIKDLNKLAMIGGSLGGSMTTVGSASIAMSQENVNVRWDQLKQVVVDRKRRMISLRNSWRALMRLYTYPENFDEVLEHVRQQVRDGIIVYKN